MSDDDILRVPTTSRMDDQIELRRLRHHLAQAHKQLEVERHALVLMGNQLTEARTLLDDIAYELAQRVYTGVTRRESLIDKIRDWERRSGFDSEGTDVR